METDLAKQRLIDFLFIMEVERWSGSRYGGTWGMGPCFSKGAERQSQEPLLMRTQPTLRGEVSPPSHGCGHVLPTSFEPLEAWIPPTVICVLVTGVWRGEGVCPSGQEQEWVGGGVRQITMVVAWTWLGSPSSLCGLASLG